MCAENKVMIWEEVIIIPTYKVHPPEKSPLFLEKRAYQGSTGKVYPLPVTEKISDTKEDVEYKAVFLENEFLKIMVLPELGGRIQRAYDKTNGYDFVYYNQVIKPALVGLTGPWISGGIEFNWPQHHRPSTYSPVDYSLSENKDGSSTIFISEIDKMYGTKGMAAISLHPGKAFIEIKGQLYNPTDLPQTFLWWANPAVPVNDNTYSVFPPDVNAVMDHGKRAVSTFPIATGEYYKCDYSAGVDISRYKNVKVPTSYMAAHSDYDFIGNYDENREAGLLHVADHHFSPGKKQWTWGNGDFGRTWDRNLTDSDGPYIELMTGVFTDNQPDFSWLKPHEEKSFVQYFMPYKGVGRVGNATRDAVLSLDKNHEGNFVLKVYSTGIYHQSAIKVTANNHVLFDTIANLTPDNCFFAEFKTTEKLYDCCVSVTYNNKTLVSYSVYEKELKPIPEPAEPMKAPADMKSLEELYLAASHLEQYRHANYDPADYYLEGLRRDATDIRLNNGYGLLLYKRGVIRESIPFIEAAIKKQTWKNPNPYSGECYFNLGLALEATDEEYLAYDAFYKATWSAETMSTGFYWLSCLSARKGNYEEALEFAEKSMISNWHNMKSRNLKAAILRKLSMDNDLFLSESLTIDPLYLGCLYEQAKRDNSFTSWKGFMRREAHNYLTLALDYMKAGLYEDAVTILSSCKDNNPLLFFYQGYATYKLGLETDAICMYKKAESSCSDYCFPNRIEEIKILELGSRLLESTPMAHYYLGNLLYDKKQYKQAVYHWETATTQNNSLAMAYRNLAIAYFNKENDKKKALKAMIKALNLENKNPRFLLEYDQLVAKANICVSERLKKLEADKAVTKSRDDLYLRYITLLNCTGQYEEALKGLESHQFHPWEGGEGKVSSQYRYALIQSAIRFINRSKPEEALPLLTASLQYPENLGEGKLPNIADNEAHYYLGISYRLMGKEDEAKKFFELAATGPTEPGSVLYYNDQPSDFIFYQGLANKELGREHAALKAYHQLIIYGEKHLFDKVSYDFFAVSLPEIEVFQDDIQLRNTQYCNYLRALGNIGLGNSNEADRLFQDILIKQDDYQGAISHRKLL